jgi:hypothetical protein
VSTIGAIALRPTGNIQGGYHLFSLLTGKIIKRHNWTRLPMPNEVINKVDMLAKEEINNQSHEEMILPNKAKDPNCNNEENQSTNTPESLYYETLDHQHNNAEGDILDDQLENEDEPEAENQMDEDVQDPIFIAGVNDNDDEDNILAENVEVVDVLPDNAREYEELVVAMDQRYGPRESGYNLRARRPRDYSHLFTTISHNVLTQYTFKKEIEMFGDKGIAAVINELKQLHDREVLEPVHFMYLSSMERQKALPYLMFLKKKRSGANKGCGCADGRRQQ